MTENFKETVRMIVDEDPRYRREAYEFVSEALNYTVNKLNREGTPGSRHISGDELLNGIMEYAIEQFGPFAGEVFKDWGLKDGLSVGNIVFNMVNHKLMTARSEDSIDDFKSDIDFEEFFSKSFEVSNKRKKITPPVII